MNIRAGLGEYILQIHNTIFLKIMWGGGWTSLTHLWVRQCLKAPLKWWPGMFLRSWSWWWTRPFFERVKVWTCFTWWLESFHLSIRRQPYARIHFGSSGRKSVRARWPPTRRPSCKLNLWVRLLAAIDQTFAHRHVLLLNHKVHTHLPSLERCMHEEGPSVNLGYSLWPRSRIEYLIPSYNIRVHVWHFRSSKTSYC